MKKTKLLTSLAALALVLSLGACTETTEEGTTTTDGDTASEFTSEDETTSESTSDGDTTPEPTAYAVVGDFVDSNWDNEPATDSKYFIPAEIEEFKVTVTTAGEPTDNEWWTDTNQWDAGLSVVEYGTWNRVAGYTELDEASTGVKGSSTSNDVSLAWNTTYDVTLTFGETNSILVELVEEAHASTPDELISLAGEGKNYSLEVTYEYWVGVNTISLQDYLAIGMGTATAEQQAAYEKCWDDMNLDSYSVTDYYISEDYVLSYTYATSGEANEPTKVELLVNYDTGVYWSYSYDVSRDEWNTASKEGTWEDEYESLFSEINYDGDSIFKYTADGTYNDVDCTTWALSDDAKDAGVTATLLENLGSFVNTNSTKDHFKYRSTSFIEEYQEMITEYYYELFKASGSNYHLTIEDIYFDVFNVGTTDKSATVTAIDTYLQNYIN